MYNSGKVALLGGDVDFVNSPISAALINLEEYTPDTVNDVMLSDIPEEAILSECAMSGKMIVGASFDADDTVFPSVSPAGINADAVVIFLDNDDLSQTRLIAIIDDAAEFPLTTSGGDITITWSESGIIGL
jgi:hypothetical protein